VRTAARVAEALGSGEKGCAPAEAMNAGPSRRGLYAARSLPAGHVVTAADVIALRPASDVSPDRQPELVGSTLVRDVAEGGRFLASDLSARAGSTGSASKGHRGVA
jgi:N-acetylneuraminate synthase